MTTTLESPPVRKALAALVLCACTLGFTPRVLAATPPANHPANHGQPEKNRKLVTNDFDVGRGFTERHGLSEPYTAHFISDDNWNPLVREVEKLSPESKWVDMGAGRGRALLEALDQGHKFQAIGIGFKHPSPTNLAADKAEHPTFRYLEGDVWSHSLEEMGGKGQVDLITDVYGPAAYSPELAQLIKLDGTLLKPGGKLFLVTSFGVSNAGENTLWDRQANRVDPISFFGNIKGMRVVVNGAVGTEFKGADMPISQPFVILERTSEPLEVPPLQTVYGNIYQVNSLARHFRMLTDVPTQPDRSGWNGFKPVMEEAAKMSAPTERSYYYEPRTKKLLPEPAPEKQEEAFRALAAEYAPR